MTSNDFADLNAAIELLFEELRVGSMQYKVLEAMANRPDNGLPNMTYDLDEANKKFAETMPDFIVPTIWDLIGMDVAPFPGLWQRIEYARDSAKSIRNAVYSLKERFETLGSYKGGDHPISLYIFNKGGCSKREVNVVTPHYDYYAAGATTEQKSANSISHRVGKTVLRRRIAGKGRDQIKNDLARIFLESAQKANLGHGLGWEIQRLEHEKEVSQS